ncbi:MAG: UDP-glucuronic acid decarboxylase family protein [Pseudomonadota bacterium]
MKYLITGAAGFLGSHLTDALLAQGHEVIGVDNLLSGRMKNLEKAAAQPGFEFVHHDVTEPLSSNCDRIFHLAAPASPPLYQKDPVGTSKTCFLGTLNVLELARETGARVTMTSTSEVYGDPTQHPQREDYHGNVNPTGPRACYDEGKRVAETLAFDFRRMHGVDVRAARLFNTYGPRMDPKDGRVVSNFIMQALTGKDITLFGDGSQTRSFCYYTDMVRGLIRLMDADNIDAPVNLGNPVEVDMHHIARIVLDIVGSSSELVYKPLPEDDPTRRKPDIRRAWEVLNWAPEVPVEEGLAQTVVYFKNYVLDQVA